MSTEEKNILIAEFHGWTHFPTPKRKGKGYYSFPEWNKAQWDADSFSYHSSWDWLMPVVEKIESTGITINHSLQWPTVEMVVGNSDRCAISGFHGMEFIVESRENLIQCVYQAVVQFIQWYNENK